MVKLVGGGVVEIGKRWKGKVMAVVWVSCTVAAAVGDIAEREETIGAGDDDR